MNDTPQSFQMVEIKDRNIWRKLKALLTSRSNTLKQSDAVTDMLMDKLVEAQREIVTAKVAAAKFAQLVIQQDAALKLAEVQLREAMTLKEEREEAHAAVVAAITAAQATV